MPRLDKTVKMHLEILEQEAERTCKPTIKNLSKNKWMDRKIISVEDWVAMAQRYDKRHKLLEFIPSDYVEPLFYHGTEDKHGRELRDKWSQDFEKYLEFKKSAVYGKFRCSFCILNPSAKLESTGLRDLFLKVLREYPEYKFPCTVINRFECPYEQGEKVGLLINLGSCWLILDEALGYARILPSKYDITIEADFEAGLADSFLYRSRRERPRYNLEECLGGNWFSAIPINGNEDIYQVLIDKNKLNIILDQYIEYLESGGYSPHRVAGRTKEEAIFLRELKDFMIGFLDKFKDEINLENLGDLFSQVTNSVDFSKGHVPTTPSGIPRGQPDSDGSFVKSGSCYSCREFANIHCVNCNLWLCTQHWKKHGTESHNKKYKEIQV